MQSLIFVAYSLFAIAAVKLDDGMIRESGVIFHKVGIADEDNDHGFKGWKMRTLSKR